MTIQFIHFLLLLGCLCLDSINNHNIQLRVLAIICNIGRIESSTQLKKKLVFECLCEGMSCESCSQKLWDLFSQFLYIFLLEVFF